MGGVDFDCVEADGDGAFEGGDEGLFWGMLVWGLGRERARGRTEVGYLLEA